MWWIQTHEDNISAVAGLSFSGAPLNGVYLAQFPHLKIHGTFPAQCPRSAPTPEELTAERVTDWTWYKLHVQHFCGCSAEFVTISAALCSGKKVARVNKKRGMHLLRISSLKSCYGIYINGPRSSHCRTLPLDRRIADLWRLLGVTVSTGLRSHQKLILKTTQHWKFRGNIWKVSNKCPVLHSYWWYLNPEYQKTCDNIGCFWPCSLVVYCSNIQKGCRAKNKRKSIHPSSGCSSLAFLVGL